MPTRAYIFDKVNDVPDSDGAAGLDARRGREDRPDQLRRQLPSAPADYLEGVLSNPALTHEEIQLLLRNRRAGSTLVARVARDGRWTRFHEIRKALVLHPNCPLSISQGLLLHLYWKDLADAALSSRAHPVVRRRSESLLGARLDGLGLGERVALATRVTRGLIPRLLDSSDGPVLARLLANPRLVESDVVRIASGRRAPGDVLARIAGHSRWSRMRDIRLAVLRNTRTPIPAALALVDKLDRRDLQQLTRDARVQRIVRVGAERRLEGSSRSDPRRSRGAFGAGVRSV